jgi:hypothetical protein
VWQTIWKVQAATVLVAVPIALVFDISWTGSPPASPKAR